MIERCGVCEVCEIKDGAEQGAGDIRQGPMSLQAAREEAYPRVAVLLATYNGEMYLESQLQSIIRQTHDNWLILVSDDGSRDGTLRLLSSYQAYLGADRLHVRQGPGRGFANNFMALASSPAVDADLFAFCDQDDIWHPDHLRRAVEWLVSVDPSRPALHCGRTQLISETGRLLGRSPLFSKSPSFDNALVQSLAGGNTMVFNATARWLLARTGDRPIVSHDWWAYLLVSGAGGLVCYRDTPTVDYRQHGANLVGANSSLRDRLYRIRRMLAGHFQEWNEINIAALEHNRDLLTEANRQTLQAFADARRDCLLARARGVLRSGVYRQTAPGNVALAVATLLGKL